MAYPLDKINRLIDEDRQHQFVRACVHVCTCLHSLVRGFTSRRTSNVITGSHVPAQIRSCVCRFVHAYLAVYAIAYIATGVLCVHNCGYKFARACVGSHMCVQVCTCSCSFICAQLYTLLHVHDCGYRFARAHECSYPLVQVCTCLPSDVCNCIHCDRCIVCAQLWVQVCTCMYRFAHACTGLYMLV